MVIANIPSPPWLQAMGQAAGTVLLLELMVALLVVLVLVAVLLISAIWLNRRVIPLFQQVVPPAQRVMTIATRSSDKTVAGIAEFYGRRQQIETGIRVLLFGRGAAERYHEEAIAQANLDLQAMTPLDQLPGPENGYTPRLPLDQPRPEAVARLDGQNANGRDIVQREGQPRPPRAPRPTQPLPETPARDDDYPNMGPLAGNAG